MLAVAEVARTLFVATGDGEVERQRERDMGRSPPRKEQEVMRNEVLWQ